MLNVRAVIEEKLKPSNLRTCIESNRTESETKNSRTEPEPKPNYLCL